LLNTPTERLERVLRVALLNERDRRVQHDDQHHRDTDRDAADDERQQRRRPQQQRQRVRELPCQLSRPVHTPGAGAEELAMSHVEEVREAVRAVNGAPGSQSLIGQTE
jgi:hypothetical protein